MCLFLFDALWSVERKMNHVPLHALAYHLVGRRRSHSGERLPTYNTWMKDY